MLAELAAANAAFAVIRTTLKNGRELVDAGQHLVEYLKHKDELTHKHNKKKSSMFGGEPMEEFLALEKLKSQEEELKQLMIYHGRAGMWADWLKFQAEYRKKQAAEKAAREREHQEFIENLQLGGAVLAVVVTLIACGWFLLEAIKHGGY